MFLTFRGWTLQPSAPFVIYVLLALAGSTMNVSFPGMHGNLSVNVVVRMLGLLELQVPEAVLVAVLGATAQTYWDPRRRGKRLSFAHLLFNTSCITLAFLTAAWIYEDCWFRSVQEGQLFRLALAGGSYFVV